MAGLGHGVFRALRDSDGEIEAQDLVVMFESALKRADAAGYSFDVSADTPGRLRDFVVAETRTHAQDIVVRTDGSSSDIAN
jgi:hypothetical protein